MLPRLAYLTLSRSIQPLALLARGDVAKDLEILVLRHQLTVLRRQLPRPRLEPADRALLAAVSRLLPRDRWSCLFVTPDTLRRWHRLVAGVWTYPHRGHARPPLDDDVQQLIVPWGADIQTHACELQISDTARLATVALPSPPPQRSPCCRSSPT